MKMINIINEIKQNKNDEIKGYYSKQHGLIIVNKDTHEYIIYQKY